MPSGGGNYWQNSTVFKNICCKRQVYIRTLGRSVCMCGGGGVYVCEGCMGTMIKVRGDKANKSIGCSKHVTYPLLTQTRRQL